MQYGCKKDPDTIVEPNNEKPVYENSGLIGKLGGRVQVSDPASAVKGAFIEVPEGMFTQPQKISISHETNIKAPTDTSALIVKFEPDNVSFSQPVKVGIPYNSTTGVTELKAFYYDDNKKKLEEIGIDSIDAEKSIVIAHLSHLSKVYCGKSDIAMNVDMFMTDGKIAGKLRIFGLVNGIDNGLSGIPTEYNYSLKSGFSNIMQSLEKSSDYTFSIFTISLIEYGSGTNYTRAISEYCVHRNSYSGADHLITVTKDNNTVFSPADLKLNSTGKLDQWYSGSTLVFRFDKFVPDAGKKYFVCINWNMAADISGFSRSSLIYGFSNVKERKTISELAVKNPDTDNNYIDDLCQRTDGNQPPLSPSSPWPPPDAVDWPTDVTLTWKCSDPENNPVRYDIYMGQTNPPTTKISAMQSPQNYNLKGLAGKTKYYWQVIAKDDHNNITPGPVWNFTTISVNKEPDIPVMKSPENNSENIPLDPVLSWNPSNSAVTYILQVSTDKYFTSLIVDRWALTSTSFQVTGLNENTQYYWRVRAMNGSGFSAWSSVWGFITLGSRINIVPCPGIPTVDYAGKIYNTVQVGSQCWLRENLDVGTMIKGSLDQTNNSAVEKYCYSNDTKNCTKYGGLYQWDEAMKYAPGSSKVQGICPEGWHIPSYDELKTLAASVSNDANALKYQGQGVDSASGTNASGFSALLAGYRSIDGVFCYLNGSIILLSSSQTSSSGINTLYLTDTEKTIGWKSNYKTGGYSVRCIKD